MDSYHNTTNSSGPELLDFEGKAHSQEEIVLTWFRARPSRKWTPSAIQQHALPSAPITSARRALTNLTTSGLLEKTDEQVKGPLGRPEYLWKLREDPRPEQGKLEI